MKITQEKTHPINRWHQSLEKKDLNILYDLLADDFHYEKEIINENSACLEFKCTMDGREVNGVDMFEWNSDNKFTEMKVLVRTTGALDVLQKEMEKNLGRVELWR